MSDERGVPLRLLLGAEFWHPGDLPAFPNDGGCQAFRVRRIEELQDELTQLNRELDAQAGIDHLVENILRASFPELQEIGGDPNA